MTRIVLTFGLIAGVVAIAGIIISMQLQGSHSSSSVWLGYLIMLVALSSILVGVRQYRDQALGGAIRFWPALGVGLAIALVATIAYVLVWEAYQALTHYSFMNDYIEAQLAAKRAAGVSGAAYQAAVKEMDAMRTQYANPLYRMMFTAIEILPVGLVVSIASAALLRNPRFLPATRRAAA